MYLKMYLCMPYAYHAVCYLDFPFSPDMICTTSATLHYAFHLSAYFFIILPRSSIPPIQTMT